MMLDNNLIRVLAACETMGNATNICSDKTGTLTQNRMTVTAGCITGLFVEDLENNQKLILSPAAKKFLAEGISVNTTASLITSPTDSTVVVSGNKTEGALLLFLKTVLDADYVPLRAHLFDASRGDRLFTFSSARKRMTVLLKSAGTSDAREGIAYVKGASEVILDRCVYFTGDDGKSRQITAEYRQSLNAFIQKMAKQSLRTVAVAHRIVSDIRGDETAEEVESDLTLDALFGIKDPLRPDVIHAVKECQAAGIFVRMVTGDNIETAKAIAKECGIYNEESGICMEGPQFRKLTPAQLDSILPRLQVLARSSPDDKHVLVTRLNGHALPDSQAAWEAIHKGNDWKTEKNLILPGYLQEWKMARKDGQGEVVGVTGDGTNDGPALKAADVGLSMGLSGTDVAKEASDIVILDDNFSSIVKAVMWGRSVFDNIRKFLQFQLTVNAVALTLTFVSALTGLEPPLNAVMMLWVNLIMDTMGALALGTEPPSPTLLDRRPYKRNASLISNKMIRNIFIQFVFQMSILAYLILPKGAADFGVATIGTRVHLTIIFNTFVFCQIFNEVNARSIGDFANVFEGLFSNVMFLAVLLFTVGSQYVIIEFGGEFVKTTHLTDDQWIKCIVLGSLSLPLGGLMRLIPVFDSESDYAELTPIMKTNQIAARKLLKSETAAGTSAKTGAKAGSILSYLLWLTTVTAIPAITYYHFQNEWKPVIIAFAETYLPEPVRESIDAYYFLLIKPFFEKFAT